MWPVVLLLREITDVVDFVGESIGDREEGEKGGSGLQSRCKAWSFSTYICTLRKHFLR